MSYNIAVAVCGGSVVYGTQWLVQATGDSRSGAFVLMAAALLSMLAAVGLRGILPSREPGNVERQLARPAA